MKILITGGAGFIASHIADAYIKAGHEVVIIDNLSSGSIENINPKAKFIKGDIGDKNIISIFEKEKFDILSHHAAQMDVRFSVSDPCFDAQNNIVASLNLYEACLKTGVKKVIFASSGGTVYGEQVNFPALEDDQTLPCSPYGISKLTNEKYLYYYKEVQGLDFTVFRYGNVYGPRQNPHGEAGVVAIFMNKIINGDQPVINGDGETTRDYIYIDDIVEANLIALKETVSGIFNVGTAIENNTNYIFRQIVKLASVKIEEYHGPSKSGEQKRAVISYDKLNKEYGWEPKVTFEKGLSLTYDYYKRLLG